MKTSKIIFISLLSTIALIILAALADLRITGKRNDGRSDDFKTSKQMIPSFKVLSLTNSNNVQIVQNDSSFIEVTYLKDSVAPDVKYTIKSDTLFISDLKKLNRRNVSISINSTDLLSRIQLKDSDFGIDNLNFKTMSFDLDKSSIWLNQNGKVKSSVSVVNLIARNHSNVDFNDFNIDSLGIVLYNSHANLMITANKINGSLSDSSRVFIRQVGEIALKKDATSNININD